MKWNRLRERSLQKRGDKRWKRYSTNRPVCGQDTIHNYILWKPLPLFAPPTFCPAFLYKHTIWWLPNICWCCSVDLYCVPHVISTNSTNVKISFKFWVIVYFCQKHPLCRFCNESMQPLLTLKGAQQMNFTKAVYLQNNKKFNTNFNIQRQSSKWHDPHIRLKFIFCNIFWTCCNFKSTLLKPKPY